MFLAYITSYYVGRIQKRIKILKFYLFCKLLTFLIGVQTNYNFYASCYYNGSRTNGIKISKNFNLFLGHWICNSSGILFRTRRVRSEPLFQEATRAKPSLTNSIQDVKWPPSAHAASAQLDARHSVFFSSTVNRRSRLQRDATKRRSRSFPTETAPTRGTGFFPPCPFRREPRETRSQVTAITARGSSLLYVMCRKKI